jgi:hypothetical protein
MSVRPTEFVKRFAERVRELNRRDVRAAGIAGSDSAEQSIDLFRRCPPDRAARIATHACEKYSGRVGRSAAAKRLDDDAVQLAVVAHIRHTGTGYDELMARGIARSDACDRVRQDVDRVLRRWRGA